jgi:hypothetical protein
MSKIENIKSKVDIIQLATFFGFEFNSLDKNRLRAKENLLRTENTSSLDFFQDTQKFYDFGSGLSGDCIDLVSKLKNISNFEAIEWLKNDYLALNTLNTPPTQKNDFKEIQADKEKRQVDFLELEKQANELLKCDFEKLTICEIKKVNLKNEVLDDYNLIYPHSNFNKLLETNALDYELLQKVNYVFNFFIGYSNYWNAPAIILRDHNKRVVDIAIYRPQKPEHFTEWNNPKYIYKNFNNRDEDWIYPFSYEVEKLIIKNKICIVGEGLKNAINGLINGIPFLSLESATSKISELQKKYINGMIKKNIKIFTCFDGDSQGLKAYENFCKLFEIETKNLIEFDRNIDFSNLDLKNILKELL